MEVTLFPKMGYRLPIRAEIPVENIRTLNSIYKRLHNSEVVFETGFKKIQYFGCNKFNLL